jgi:hypothetical protein
MGNKFSNVLYIMTLHSKYTRTLTLKENSVVFEALVARQIDLEVVDQVGVGVGGCGWVVGWVGGWLGGCIYVSIYIGGWCVGGC